MNPDDERCPIRMQSVPIGKELYKTPYDLEDPLHEDEELGQPGEHLYQQTDSDLVVGADALLTHRLDRATTRLAGLGGPPLSVHRLLR